MKLIAISGKAGSGKDTVAKMLKDINPRYNIVHFADSLKHVASELSGIYIDKWYEREFKETHCAKIDCTGRDYLVRLGDALRLFDADVFIKATINNLQDTKCYLIPDMRYPNEVAAIRKAGGITIRVNRPGIDSGTHPSETALDGYKNFHYTINNDGDLPALVDKVVELYRSLAFREEFPNITKLKK